MLTTLGAVEVSPWRCVAHLSTTQHNAAFAANPTAHKPRRMRCKVYRNCLKHLCLSQTPGVPGNLSKCLLLLVASDYSPAGCETGRGFIFKHSVWRGVETRKKRKGKTKLIAISPDEVNMMGWVGGGGFAEGDETRAAQIFIFCYPRATSYASSGRVSTFSFLFIPMVTCFLFTGQAK